MEIFVILNCINWSWTPVYSDHKSWSQRKKGLVLICFTVYKITNLQLEISCSACTGSGITKYRLHMVQYKEVYSGGYGV